MRVENEYLCRVCPANLTPHQIKKIGQIESTFGNNVCLVAVKRKPLFVLEAKTAPNQWGAIGKVYPQDDLPSWYTDRDEANAAKALLKGLLHGKWKQQFKKYPIRVREVNNSLLHRQ